MPTTTTFTTTAGTSSGNQYFQDIELSPVTLASAALLRRFDTLRYPGNGTKHVFAPTITAVAPAGGAAAGAYPVVITGSYFEYGVVVTVSGAGVTVTDTRISGDQRTIQATFTVAEGAAATARNVTVTNPDTGAVTSAGTFTVA